MIDFRYHLVSLISVFLALAVGIALGAGPLKESIGDTLTGQVDQLRAEKDELRAEVDQLSGDLADAEDALTTLAPSVLEGVLGGRRVAVVVLDEVDQTVVEQVSRSVTQAGGTVSAVATVTSAWTDPTRSTFRQSLAATMVGYLDTPPAEDAGTDTELAEALAQALTLADPADPDQLSEHAEVLLDLFSGDAGLVTLADPVSAPADAVLVLAGPITVAEDETPVTDEPSETSDVPSETPTATPSPTESAVDSGLEAEVAAWTEIAVAAQRRSAGTAVITGAVADSGLVASIRTTAELAELLSTVDGVTTATGTMSPSLALANRIAGVVGQYGSGPDATAAIPPRIALPVIERVAAVPEPAAEDTTDGTDTAGQG